MVLFSTFGCRLSLLSQGRYETVPQRFDHSRALSSIFAIVSTPKSISMIHRPAGSLAIRSCLAKSKWLWSRSYLPQFCFDVTSFQSHDSLIFSHLYIQSCSLPDFWRAERSGASLKPISSQWQTFNNSAA